MDNISSRFVNRSVNPTAKRKRRRDRRIVEAWNAYFGEGALADFQRLMADLGLTGDFSSKTKCRNALRGVWINIVDFLACKNRPEGVRFFSTERALAEYSRRTRKIYPRDSASEAVHWSCCWPISGNPRGK